MKTFLEATSAGRLAGFRSSLLICEDINKDVAVFAAGRPMLVPGGAVGYGHTLNLLSKRFGRYTRITLFRVLCFSDKSQGGQPTLRPLPQMPNQVARPGYYPD